MTGEVLTTTQRNAILALMAEAAEVSNAELKEKYGVDLTGQHRMRLNDLKLVASRKVGRTYHHELLDAGWARCRDELGAPRSPRSNIALHAVMTSLDRYLRRQDLSLAAIFAQPPAGVEGAIVTAYGKLAERPGDLVRLSALRARLRQFDRAAVDDALVRLAKSRQAALVPDDDQKNLRRDQREAAIRFGDRTNHLISIEAM